MEFFFQKVNFFLEWKGSGADIEHPVQKGLNAIDFKSLAGAAEKTSTKFSECRFPKNWRRKCVSMTSDHNNEQRQFIILLRFYCEIEARVFEI